MEDIKLEKLIENSPNPVSIEGTEKILFQMKKCICKIYNKNKKGTGFFLKISYPMQNNLLYLLVTNNHILEESDLKNGKIIETTINDDSLSRNIVVKNSRKRYTCSDLDITVVEIFPNIDKIEDFLELDDKINSNIEILEKIYRNKSIYILHYPKGNKSHVSYGLLSYINKGDLNHYCSTEDGSSGSPVLSLDSNKVIGIHKGCLKKENTESNIGIFIKVALDKLYSKYWINNELGENNKNGEKNSENENDSFEGEIKSYNNLKCEKKKFENISLNNLKDKRKIKTSPNTNESNSNNMNYRSKNTINENKINTNLNSYKNIKNNQNNKIAKNNFSNLSISSDKELLGIMNNLFSENGSEKMNVVIFIYEILCSNYQQNKYILIPNIDNIIKIIIKKTHELFFNPINKIKSKINSLKFTKYLVIILCKLTSNKELIIHISYKVLYDLCYELLNYLLIDNDLFKIASNKEENIILFSINSSMLRVIENCDITSVILVLLEIIKQYQNNIKLSILTLKCLLKATQNIQSIINTLKLHKILLQMHLIINNLGKLSKNKREKNFPIMNFIKNFIIDIVKIKKEEIIEDYNKSIANSEYIDNHIYNWIINELELFGCSMSEKKFKELNKDRAKNSNNSIKNKKTYSVDKIFDKKFNRKLNKSNIKKPDNKKYNIKTPRSHKNFFNLNYSKSSIFETSKNDNKNNLDN